MSSDPAAELTIRISTFHRDYLLSLVRMDERKRARALATLKAYPGQTEADFAAFRARMEGRAAFIHEVFERLHAAKLSGPNRDPGVLG